MVAICGSSFKPKEAVALHIDASHGDTPWDGFATPDAFGKFSNSQFAIQPDSPITFTLTSTGQGSGLTATTMFTSAPTTGCPLATAITTDFTGTAIAAANYIWFTSVLKPTALRPTPLGIYYTQ